jgi:peptide/nickel transport system permease protein
MSAEPVEQPGRGALRSASFGDRREAGGYLRPPGTARLRLRNALRTLRSRKKLTAGLIVLLFVILVGVFSGEICNLIGQGQNPISIGFGPRFAPSTWATPLGTDEYGRDILALTVTGLWTSLKVGFYAGVLSTLIGVTIAFFAAYRGGLMDSTLRTVTDTFLVVPALPLLIAFTGFAKNVSLFEVALILAVFSWAFAARPIRSQVLSLRTRGYVDLAKVSRLNTVEIVFEELVPNMLPYIILGLSFAVIGAIFALISLEIIGLGPTNLIDLGLLINSAISSGALTLGAWPLFVGPIVAIVLLFGALSLINIGLDEVFNPRLRRVAGV